MTLQTTSRRRSAARRLRAHFLLSLIALLVLPEAGSGQQQQQRRRRASTAAPVTEKAPNALPRLAVSESGVGGDVYRSGEVFVRATSNSHMIVPIGMSKGGVVLAEFPAADPLYSFHEGNARLAYVNCGQQRGGEEGAASGDHRKCSMRPSDALVLQPGLEFTPPVKGREAEATAFISVQRVSGMVVTFMIYPVLTGAESATRVVVSYDVGEVSAARQKAGLLTRLVPADALTQSGVPQDSLQPGRPSPARATAAAPNPPAASPATVAVDEGAGAPAAPSPDEVVRESVVAELQRVAGRDPELRFSKPVHGLAVAVIAGGPPVADMAVQVVAVRNALAAPVRLLPDQPDLRIMQSAKKGEAILDQSVAVAHIATTLGDDNVLMPGEVYYFAVAYAPPALGVRQALYVSFAHMQAADEPAVVPLASLIASR